LKHKTARRVALKSVANNSEIDSIHARMRPAIELFRRKRDWNNRLMTGVFDSYELAHSDRRPSPLPESDPHPNPLPMGEGGRRPGEGITGVWNGLKRKTARRVTLKSVAKNPEIDSAHVRMPLAIELCRRKHDWNNRLMTAVFDSYELAHSDRHPSPFPLSDPHPNPLPGGEGWGEGIKKVWNGLKHKTAPQVALKSIAKNLEIDSISARIRPAMELCRRKRDWNNRLMTAVFDYYELAHSDPHPNPLPGGEGLY
jgi:hypothetical protein